MTELHADLHVLVASVPWRVSSLNALLHDVAAQTVLPMYVHLVLDGYGPGDALPSLDPLSWDGLRVTVNRQHPARGAGSRWDVAVAQPSDDILASLDDDVKIPRDYLARHLAAMGAHDAVASGGWGETGRHGLDDVRDSFEGPVVCLMAGASTFRVRCLRELRQVPLSDVTLGVQGDDEGLISAHLFRQGIVPHRVAVPVAFDPLAHDPRAQGPQRNGDVLRLRRALRDATGWPWSDCWA